MSTAQTTQPRQIPAPQVQPRDCGRDVFGFPCDRAHGHTGPCINHFQMRK